MAREIKEILEGVDSTKLSEFTVKAAAAASAAEVKALAAEYGVELAKDEAGGIYTEFQRRASEEIAIDELDNVAGGCNDDFPCRTYWC